MNDVAASNEIQAAALPLFGIIPRERIRLGKWNPRKRITPAELQEMGASIKLHGIMSPILVRPIEGEDDMYELVFGERRFRGAEVAGLEGIPCQVRVMTDKEVRIAQHIENLQRKDVHPIEEAEGYAVLMKEDGYTVDQLADEVGMSRSYIYGRLKFSALASIARDAFFEGKLIASTALLIARIPVESLQELATEEILNDGNPLSYRDAFEHIQLRYMLDLDRARFSIKDAKLVKEAGSCDTCPKRTGNQAILYPDLSADICTDPNCFASKSRAHDEKTLTTAKKKGVPVYEGEEATEFLDDTELVSTESRLYRYDRPVDRSTSYSKTVEDVLQPDQLPEPQAFVRVDGKVKALYEPTAMQEALEKAGVCKAEEREEQQQDAAPAGGKAVVRLAAPQPDLREMVAELETKVRVTAYKRIREKAEGGMYAELLRSTMKSLLGLAGNYSDFSLPDDVLQGVYDFDTSTDEAIAAYVDQADVAQLLLLLMDAVFGRTIDVSRYDITTEGSIDEEDADYLSFKDLAAGAGIALDDLRAELTPAPEEPEDENPEQSVQVESPKKQPARRKKKAVDTANTEDDKPSIDPATAWPFPTGGRP